MAYISRYVYCNCADPIVGCSLYSDQKLSIPIVNKFVKLIINNVAKNYATNASGTITSITTCFWESTKYNQSLYTANKNDCAIGACSSVIGNSVTLNDNGTNVYITSGYATSSLSQGDADSKAQAIADAAFLAGRQAKINEYGTCTWTASNISATYPATSYTRNNCSAGCYGTSVTYGPVTKSGYSAQSNNSCQDAINTAYAAAYMAAENESNSLGQAYANTNGSCCCWVSDPYCVPGTCNYQGNRQRNTCTGEYRYTETTSTTNCGCGVDCGGYFWRYYCDGTSQYRIKRYYCNNTDFGSAELVSGCSASCGASTSPTYTYQSYACYSCTNVDVYRDTNPCSSTYLNWYVYYNSAYVQVGGQPTTAYCNYTSNCVDTGTPYCNNGNYVTATTQNNPCSGVSCGIRIIDPNSTTYGCYDPCTNNTAPYYTDQGYTTCYNCNNVQVYLDTNSCSSTSGGYYLSTTSGYVFYGSQPTGGTCNTSTNCVDTGSPFCQGPNWVIAQTQGNPCSTATCGYRTIEPNSVEFGCYTPSYTVNIYGKKSVTLGTSYLWYGVNNTSTSQGGATLSTTGTLLYSFSVTSGSTVYVSTKLSTGDPTSACFSISGYCTDYSSYQGSFTITGNTNIYVATNNAL